MNPAGAMERKANSLLQAATLAMCGIDTRRWVKRIWKFIGDDGNPHFAALRHIVDGREMSQFEGANLERSRTDTPYPGFFRWEKPPEQWWVERPDKVGPAMDWWVPRCLYRDVEPAFQ